MDRTISEAGQRIIDAVIDAPVAWRSPGELAHRLGWSLDQTLDEIADLDIRGWVEAWELIDGPVVTLSVAASASCGVRLVEVGQEATTRWARSGDPDPPGVPASGVFRSQQMAMLDLVADSRPSVELAAMRTEEAEEAEALVLDRDEARLAARLERLPKPTLFVGGGLSPWPGPNQVVGETCPACRSARLPARAYCLWCDRWGLDAELVETSVVRSKPRRPSSQAKTTQKDAQRHEAERRRRRTKRKERRAAQARQLRSVVLRDEPIWSGPRAS